MRFESYKSNVFAFLIFLFVYSLLSAQVVPIAQVNGTLKDQSDALLPGVGVKVTQTVVSRITCKRELCCR
jgi:hypothetical protein